VSLTISANMYQFGSHSTVFNEIVSRRLTLKYLEGLQISLKFGKIVGHITLTPKHALLPPATSNSGKTLSSCKMVWGSQHRHWGKKIMPTRHNVTLNCIAYLFLLPVPFSESYVLTRFTLFTALNSSARHQLHEKMVVFTCSLSKSYFIPGKTE